MSQTSSFSTHIYPVTDAAASYILTRQFILRMSGFPVQMIEPMASPLLGEHLDRSRSLQSQVVAAAHALLAGTRNLRKDVQRSLKRYVSIEQAAECGLDVPAVLHYNALIAEHNDLKRQTHSFYAQELDRARRLLYRFVVSERFQEVLLLSSPSLSRFTPADVDPPTVRNSHVRQRELSWISYLQRLATKNETISSFGPSAWGEIDVESPAAAAVTLREPFIAERAVYIERWVAESLAELISQDVEIAPLLQLRIADDLLLEAGNATFLLSGTTVFLTEPEQAFLDRCATSLLRCHDSPLADDLLARGLLVRKVQIRPEPFPVLSLQEEVSSWPEHPQKVLWSERLARLDSFCRELEQAAVLEERRTALQEITSFLAALNISAHNDSQVLYSSRLPVNEDCRLNAEKLSLGKPFLEPLLVDAAPWFDLWRDIAGLYATRLYENMRASWLSMGAKPIPLLSFRPAMFKAWTELRSLDEEIQQAWSEQIGERSKDPSIHLSAEDTTFLRRRFKFRRMKNFDNMSPDLQIIAPDADALKEGRWTLLIAEIHPDFTPWESCFFMWCPAPETFAADYASEDGQGAAVVVGNRLPYFSSAHTSFWVYSHAHQWTFIGAPAARGLKSLRSAEAFIRVTDDDVIFEDASGRFLGSYLYTWQTAMNTHRMDLQGDTVYSPRMYLGPVVVQRASWKIKSSPELVQAAKAGGVVFHAAFRAYREQYGLPEKIFLRGCMTERFSLNKDVKPVYLDFRNPLLVELAGKMISRFETLSITEMLPATEDCWIQGKDGHYSSEFRTVVLATRESRASGVFSNLDQ